MLLLIRLRDEGPLPPLLVVALKPLTVLFTGITAVSLFSCKEKGGFSILKSKF